MSDPEKSDLAGGISPQRHTAASALQAESVENRIHAIEKLGQHGGMPAYWRKPLALAFAADEVAAHNLLAAADSAYELLAAWLHTGKLPDREHAYAVRDGLGVILNGTWR